MSVRKDILKSINGIFLVISALFLWRLGVAKGLNLVNFFLLCFLFISFAVNVFSFFGLDYPIEQNVKSLLSSKKKSWAYDSKDIVLFFIIGISLFISIDQEFFAMKLDSILSFMELELWIHSWMFHCLILLFVLTVLRMLGIAVGNKKLMNSEYLFIMFYFTVFALKGGL